jgi:ferredoxin
MSYEHDYINPQLDDFDGASPKENSGIFIELDYDFCRGCGLCVLAAPNIFQFGKSGITQIHQATEPQFTDRTNGRIVFNDHINEAFDAVDECPEEAISITLVDD